MNQTEQTDLQPPPLEAPRLRSLSEVHRERVDWKRRDALYEAVWIVSEAQVGLLYAPRNVGRELNLTNRIVARLRKQIAEINDQLDAPGSGVFRYSKPTRIARGD